MYNQSVPQTRPQFKPQSTPILVNGRTVGRVEDNTFHKTIDGSKHLLRTPRAIAFDRSTLQDAQAAGATSARVFDRETGTDYTASLERIHAEGFPVRRGYGDQWALALEKWSVNGQRPVADVRAAQSNQEVKALQAGLFAADSGATGKRDYLQEFVDKVLAGGYVPPDCNDGCEAAGVGHE